MELIVSLKRSLSRAMLYNIKFVSRLLNIKFVHKNNVSNCNVLK